MIIRQGKAFEEGYTALTRADDSYGTMMDFGWLVLNSGKVYYDGTKMEKAYLLIKGKVIFEWNGYQAEAERDSCFDENPLCLHVPSDVDVKVTSLGMSTEISVTRTQNEKQFPPRFYEKKDCRSVEGGRGVLGEASLRNIRTIFDLTNAPDSNLVLGEVVHQPGCWSSYPPHHHPQPEIYFYRFMPRQGFGYCDAGGNVYKVGNNDCAIISDGSVHPQVGAPGYAMYYIWAIRHLVNKPFDRRIYAREHEWLLDNPKIWPDMREGFK